MAALAASAGAAARLDGDWIVIEGAGNTLESVANDIGSEAILSHDPETGYALSARSFRVEGELTIGGPATTGSLFRHVASLEFDVGQVGQARILLPTPAAGESAPLLVVENSRLATMHTEKGNDACNAEGNLVEVEAGRFALRSSTVSGNFVIRARGGAVEIVDSLVSTTNHAGVSLGEVQSGETRIEGLKSLDHLIYGMEVGPVQGPVVMTECVIRGGGADLHVRGKTELVARDCDLDSIRFAGNGGTVARQWTVAVHTGQAGAKVVAESEKSAGMPERVEAAADNSGVAHVTLTEYTAKPGGLDYLRAGRNDSTPHRITIYGPDGETVLATVRNYRVLTRGQEVRIQ